MTTKKLELSDPKSTWNKIPEDEPVFILRARDVIAPMVIGFWIQLATTFRAPNKKLEEARATLRAMEKWEGRKYPD